MFLDSEVNKRITVNSATMCKWFWGVDDKAKVLLFQPGKQRWETVESDDGNSWSNELKNKPIKYSKFSHTKGR